MRHFHATVSAKFLLLCLCVHLSGGCTSNDLVTTPKPKVMVAKPRVQTIRRSLEFTGNTGAYETVMIKARVKGFLEEIKFQDGADVKAGDVLYVIDQEPFKVKVKEAEAAVELAKAMQLEADAQMASGQAELKNAQVQLARAQAAGDAVAAAEVDERQAGLGIAEAKISAATAVRASADAQLMAAEAALAEAKLELGYTEVRAPIDGQVEKTQVDVGNLVGASETTHLTTVERSDPIYVYFTISESVLLQFQKWRDEGRLKAPTSVEERQKLEVLLGLGNDHNYPFRGTFDYADPFINQTTGTKLVRAKFDNPNRSIPLGAFVRVSLPLFPEEATLVDEVAVGRDDAGSYVLVVDDNGTVERRAVEVGEVYKRMRIIESGLGPEDRVVVNGLQRARPGGEVEPVEQEMLDPDNDQPAAEAPADTPAEPAPAAEAADSSSSNNG